MNRDQGVLRSRYLDLMERSLLNHFYGESKLDTTLRKIVQRIRRPILTRRGTLVFPGKAHSMLSAERMHNLRILTEQTIQQGITGDYIETGVWRGGACIMMKAVLAAYGASNRRVYCADSFRGLPRPDPKYPADKRNRLYKFDDLAVSVEEVRKNFAAYDLLDDNVVFIEGLFRDTLSQIDTSFSLIRLDGDMYGSTMDALINLYDRLSPGGFCIVDDYGVLGGCRMAVHDFLDARSCRADIQKIDISGVWWRKP